MRWILDLLRDEDATTAIEYAVMLFMILGVVIGSVGMLGTHSGELWGMIRDDLNEAGF